MARLSEGLAALVVAVSLVAAPAFADSAAPQRLSIETLPYPAGVTKPGANVSYVAPDLSALRHSITYDGSARSYYLHVPDTAASGPRPVILLLHGAQRDGASMIDMWRNVADQHGAVLVAPDSFGAGWSPVEDHPNFLMTTLRDASVRAPLDPSRVYLFGHSAGGVLATLYGNRVGAPWRAVATHAGTLDPANIAQAEAAPPMRHYVGTNDHLFPGRAAQVSAQALVDAGHEIELRMIRGHTHWYYAIGPHLSEEIWAYWQGLE
ncbi:hypothetical protein So717_16600 [Roseobacter cerasinus]|uniref:AB hydrolase-1 domain-containing protein n=1 Tax=Roseobacter cerasinus TaxID=2602289 RepID=A0A640VQ84_9RHOB|nr:alpha/beta fold hydrolase [Roseobacter cerasinus]GFE49907.1 hypothetical protein So717_16600 [Roseobacter cerasinus]